MICIERFLLVDTYCTYFVHCRKLHKFGSCCPSMQCQSWEETLAWSRIEKETITGQGASSEDIAPAHIPTSDCSYCKKTAGCNQVRRSCDQIFSVSSIAFRSQFFSRKFRQETRISWCQAQEGWKIEVFQAEQKKGYDSLLIHIPKLQQLWI